MAYRSMCRSLPARSAVVLALLVGLHVTQARPAAAQQDELHHVPEIPELQEQPDAGRVLAGSVASAYGGALPGVALGFLIDRGGGCGSGSCDWDGFLGAEIGAVAGTVIGSVLVSHWLNERRGNLAVDFLVTAGVTTGALALLNRSSPEGLVLALPALTGLTAGLTELATGRRAPPAKIRVLPPPPHPDR